LLVFAIPAAAVPRARIGQRINVLLGTPTTFPANQPFHVAHGWIGFLHEPQQDHFQAIGKFAFRLELDGQAVEPDFVDRWVSEDTLHSSWVHNFPTGLSAGPHTFNGYFTGPCKVLVSVGYNPGPCPKQNEVILAGGAPATLTVEFTP
jgi:hypothetical protein